MVACLCIFCWVVVYVLMRMSVDQSIQVSTLERYTARMADIRISRHPLRRTILFIVNHTEFDMYNDSRVVETCRVLKQAIVKKNPDMYYVQENFGADVLVEDGDKIPWVITMTCLGLPRLPMLDDRIWLDGIIYSVSAVKPVNRDNRGVLEVMVYPERVDYMDRLAVYAVSFREGMVSKPISAVYNKTVVMDVIWGGYPMRMSFDKKRWLPFSHCSEVKVPRGARSLYVQDAQGVTAEFSFHRYTEGESVGGFTRCVCGDSVYLHEQGRVLYIN